MLMVIPLGAFGLGMLASGALSVVLYRRRNPGANLTGGIGARLGAISGAVGSCIFGIISAVGVLITNSGGQLRAALLDAIQQSAARNGDPQAQEVVSWLRSPAGLTFLLCFGLAVLFGIFILLSTLGGAVTASLLRRRNQQ